MSISKKISLAMLALFAAVCMAVGLFLLPAFNPSAAGDELLTTLGTGTEDDAKYFKIDKDTGEFTGLTAEGNLAVGNKKTKIVLPASVKSIGAPTGSNQSVFDNAVRPYIVEVAYDDGCALTHIRENAFNGCINMTTLNIPNSAAEGLTIHENAFANCTGVTTINYYAQKATVMANMGNPFAINNDNYINPVTVNIIGTANNPIKQIPKELFCRVTRENVNETVLSVNGHKGIQAVNFEHVVLSGAADGEVEGEAAWGINAFRDCTSLEKVTFKNCTIPYINNGAFNGCTSLNSIEGLEDINLVTIADEAFLNCSSLFSVKLGKELKSINGENVFAGCTRLIEVVNLSSLPLTPKGTGYGRVAENAMVIHTTDTTSIKQYQDFSFITDTSLARKPNYLLGYSGKATSITLPEKYNNAAYYIFKKAFYNEKNLKSVTLPTGAVTEIWESAFAESGITSITFPSDLVGIYSGAFENCASLSSVTFDTDANGNSAIQQLGSNAFKGCAKLESIKFPKSVTNIGGAAFENCTMLKKVEFFECLQNHEHNDDCKKLKTIGGSAFAGCTSLKTVKIPAQVSTIENLAFSGCDSLQTVYLPVNSSYSGENVFGTANDKLVLIAANKAAYNEIIADAENNNAKNLRNYKDNLTYTVYVKLEGSGYTESAVYKLFNKNGSYEVQNDGSWESGHTMPTQNGYKRSVWYDSDSYATQVNIEKLTEMLKTQTNFETGTDGYDYLTIYAKYISYPEFQNISSLEYYSGMELGMEGILDKCFGNATRNSDYIYTVSEHYFSPNGYEEKDNEWNWSNSGVIKDAGKYFLQIDLNPDYGEWAEPCKKEFYITPINIDISENNLVKWKPVGADSTTLLPELGGDPTTLYFYGNPLIPYLKEQAGLTGKGSREVINSYALYTGSPIELELVWRDGISYGKIVEGSYETFMMKNNEEVPLGSNAQTAQGIYFTRVDLQSNNNYRLVVNGLDSNNEKTLTDLGLKFKSVDGKYTVTKTWYIAVSDSLHLAQNDDKKNTAYGVSVDGNGTIGTYLGEIKLPERPAVMTFMINGVVQTGVAHNELISFTLERNGEMITKNGAVKLGSPAAASDNFEYYINRSMPAGNYVLTFYIDDYKDVNGKVLVVGNHGGQEFNFIIAEASLDNNRVNDVKKMLVDASVTYDSTAKYQFASTKNIGLLNSDSNQITNRLGVWVNYTDLYKNFEIFYSVKTGAKKNYTDNDVPTTYNPISSYEDGTAAVIPKGLGVYTVYYQIKAPNYSTVIAGVYELKITYKLTHSDFAVGDFEYTGSSLVSQIKDRLDPRDLDAYNIYTYADDSVEAEALRKAYNNGSRDSYTSTGTHYVYIAIKDSHKDYISFDNSPNNGLYFVSPIVNGSSKTFLRVEINIVASKNSVLTHLAVDNWEYGEFLWENRPAWDLLFNRNYETYWFVLTSKDNAEKQYWLYGKKDLNDKLEDGKLGFNKAPRGEYILTGYAPSENDGIEPFEVSIDVTVLKATPKFSTHPYIDGWVYGYDKFEDNLNAAKILSNYPLSGNGSEIEDKIVVKYATEAEFRKDDPTLHEKLSSLYGANNQLSVGYYYLVFTLADGVNDNFTSWQYGVRFRVVKGQNYWNTTPVMHDWIYGDDNVENNLKYEPKFGNVSDVKLEYRSTDSVLSNWVGQISALKEYKNGHLSVGTYEFRATVAGTGNYDDLVFQMTFNVIPRTQNVWKDAPSIKGWVKGNFKKENLPFATAAVGEVTYTVTDEDGKVYELDTENASKVLNGLKVGTYTLTATVVGTDEYETLTTSVEFSVSEDAVTMTGLMVATIVFAVIAVGLAAAGLTLFILQSKRADAEFRRAVRNELRRK